MEKHVTIRDIAAEMGVSTGTVHRAIYGKKGVSAEMQRKILDLCIRRGYRANIAASALKRRPLRIVGAFPVPDGKSQYFYSQVWQGFRRYMDEIRDYNIEAVELFYYQGTTHDQSREILDCYQRYQGEIDALITIGHLDKAGKEALRLYTANQIPVFLACDDLPDCGRIACVQANYEMTGRMVAELLASQIPAGSSILLCAGDALVPSHAQTIQGFERHLQEDHPDLVPLKFYGYENEYDLRTRLHTELEQNPSIRAAFSVSARLSVLLAEEVVAASRLDTVRIVASDLFDETVQNMEQGIVKNIVHKNPEQQAYLAAKHTIDYLLKAKHPLHEVEYVKSCIIFKSNLEMYL